MLFVLLTYTKIQYMDISINLATHSHELVKKPINQLIHVHAKVRFQFRRACMVCVKRINSKWKYDA